MNFEVLVPHRYDAPDGCHYLDVTEARLECDFRCGTPPTVECAKATIGHNLYMEIQTIANN